jgi:3-isopropylmalate/(R)-2-methylmalate dehydratase small subunit
MSLAAHRAEPFGRLTSTAVLLPHDDIDTDQIIPARFLTTTERAGLGAHLFADWRFDRDGRPRGEFPLNVERARVARILVAGRNFGCGSSREHAPWALIDFGFRVVVAPSFGDIFRENALKNGLLPVALTESEHAAVVRNLARDSTSPLHVDLDTQTIELAGTGRFRFPVDPFAKHCLALGVDQLGYLIDASGEIAAYERTHRSTVRT